jgi:hypothetical protein
LRILASEICIAFAVDDAVLAAILLPPLLLLLA